MGSNHSSVRSHQYQPNPRPTAMGSNHSSVRFQQHHPGFRPSAMALNQSSVIFRQHRPNVHSIAISANHSSGRFRQYHANLRPTEMGYNHTSVRFQQHHPGFRPSAMALNQSSVLFRQHHPNARPTVMGLNHSPGRPSHPAVTKGAAESCKYNSAFLMRQRPAGPLCPWALTPMCRTSPAVSVIRERCLPQFVHLLQDRTLVFIGDSLSRQHFYALACDLWAYAARELVPGGRSAHYVNICNGELSTKAFLERQSQAAQCSHCCNHHCLVFGRVRMCFVLGSKRTTPSLNVSSIFGIVAARLKPSDIVVANIGVHWGPEKLEALTRALLDSHNAVAADSRPLLIWRESGPQHYLGGEYLPSRDSSRSRTQCTPFDAQTYASSSFNFRNRIANPLMNASGVHVLRIFDASSANFASHLNPGRDCTHWCFDGRAGSGVLSMWNYRLFTLLRRSSQGVTTDAGSTETRVSAAAASRSATAASALMQMQEQLCDMLVEEFAWPSSWPSRASSRLAPCRLTQRLGEAWKANKSLWRVQEA